MDLMNQQQSERETQRAQAGRDELIERVARAVGDDGTVETPGRLRLLRHSSPTPKEHGVSSPAFCLIAQGSKEVLLGDDLYRYDANHYLITAAALPTATRVTEASEERPYLGVVLGLDPALVGSVMVEAGHPAPGDRIAVRAFEVSPLDAGLLDAVVRLVGLLDSPAEEARFLRPLVIREIVFRLLKGEQGDRLRQIAVLGGHSHRIARAIERLQKDFDRPLRIEDIARELGMSVSGFHHHFRAVTAMSPLQFQKQMRLQETRRLMLGEDLDAASAGYRVGYGDASHFTREYKRLFGAPPARDVERLRVPPGRVEPNASHLSLLELQRLGKLKFLVTQNTDDLHRRSGIRPGLLAELHGNGRLMRCLGCDRLHERREAGWDARRWGPGYRTQGPLPGQPACAACGGRLVSSVVNFGDALPQRELALAEEHARRCDLMLVLGSSLVVEPAASLVGLALGGGARVVLVNRGETPYDRAATLRAWAGIGEVMPPAVERAKRALGERPNRS